MQHHSIYDVIHRTLPAECRSQKVHLLRTYFEDYVLFTFIYCVWRERVGVVVHASVTMWK